MGFNYTGLFSPPFATRSCAKHKINNSEISIPAFKQPMQHVEQRVLQSKKEVGELLEQCFEIRDKLSKEVQEKVKAAAFKLKSRHDLLKSSKYFTAKRESHMCGL